MPRRRALTRSALPATVGVAALLLACVAVVMASRSPQPRRATAAAVVGMETSGSSSVLRRYDPLTLRRVGRRSLTLRFGLGTWSASPDGRMLALGGSLADVVTVIDPRTLRPISSTSLHGGGYVADIAWLAGGSLAVLSTGPRCCGLDATTLSMLAEPGGKLLWQHHFGDGLVDAASANGTLAFLLVPRDRIGAARIYAWTARGGGGATLHGVESGSARTHPLRLTPALALDPRAVRGYVVSPAGTVATVDLAAMTVHTRQVGAEPFPGRPLPTAVPRRTAEVMVTPGAQRRALMVGPHTLAVWGDDAGVIRHGSRWSSWSRPSGLSMVDTRTWRVSRLDETSDGATEIGDTLLATGTRGGSADSLPRGYGISGYDRRGRRRFHLLPGSWVQVLGQAPHGRVAYVLARKRRPRWVEIDVRRGRILGPMHDPPTLLSSPGRLFGFM